MKIKWRKDKPANAQPDAEATTESHEPAASSLVSRWKRQPLTSEWTQGSSMMSKAFTGLICGVFMSGPIALAMVLFGGTGTQAAAPTLIPTQNIPESQRASEFAVNFAVTWLRATHGQEDLVAAYMGGDQSSNLRLPDTAPIVAEPTAADVTSSGKGTYTVTVAATVSGQTSAPARRYFSVAVATTPAGIVAAALPTPAGGPQVGRQLRSGYGSSISSNSPAWAAVEGFLGATLAGLSDVSRFTSPGSSLDAVTPVPYSAVTVSRLDSNRELTSKDDAPATGAQIRVMATVTVTSPGGDSTLQYPLTLAGRDGRWEIADIDQVPIFTVPTTAPSESP